MRIATSIPRFFIAVISVLMFAVSGISWTLDKSRVRWDIELTQSEQSRYDVFQNAVHNDGHSPRDAARIAGDTDFKQLSDGTYQIRLSQRARVRMQISWNEEKVTILQVGGHT